MFISTRIIIPYTIDVNKFFHNNIQSVKSFILVVVVTVLLHLVVVFIDFLFY